MAARDLAPLFIVGAPRSGTSLLYKLLCLHPRAAWISNWGRRAPGQPALAMAFPRARFVNLIRDGRAVAYSLSRVDWWEDGVVWWYGQTPRRWREEGRDPWELCALHWVRELAAVDAWLRALAPEARARIEHIQHTALRRLGHRV